MKKGYFSKQAKCERKGYAPCFVDKEQLQEFLQLKATEIFAFAKEVLGASFPKHFELPKILLLSVNKNQSFGKYAYNMVLQGEEKLVQASEEEKALLEAKLAKLKANVKIEQPVRGSFFVDGGIVIYYCNICQLCQKEQLEFADYITSVLAHEIFHGIHFACCDGTQKWEQVPYWNGKGYDYAKVSTVREALAEYFRYLWLKQQQQDALFAIMFKDLAKPYATVPNYPYAGLKNLLSDEQASLGKFQVVLKASLENWHDAYDKLTS